MTCFLIYCSRLTLMLWMLYSPTMENTHSHTGNNLNNLTYLWKYTLLNSPTMENTHSHTGNNLNNLT